jgi:formate hydrogenlyase transcriptional activator
VQSQPGLRPGRKYRPPETDNRARQTLNNNEYTEAALKRRSRPEYTNVLMLSFDYPPNRRVDKLLQPMSDDSREPRDQLEQSVRERTAELTQTIQALQREIEELKQAQAESLDEIARLKQLEPVLPRSDVTGAARGESIIGESKPIKEILQLVHQVASTDSSVLIVGETGTGKELIAESIHQLSSRKHQAMVKVNCAALPSALVESELFGREKGAYTGALTRQAGRFETANHSTIFLDEVGELSPDVQAKLLRVLQEGWFERLGNPRPIKVDVRVIAATNRDLATEMRKGHFREDLFYRLNVFPLKVPPLRERPEDVPVLVWAFLEEFCARMGRKVTKVPQKTMDTLQRHSWPGNVRELRNIMEHGVIISHGDTLRIPDLEDSAHISTGIISLEEMEREQILRALEITHWRIKGPRGAAEQLDVKPSTLYSRMEKLGIPTRRQKDQTAS